MSKDEQPTRGGFVLESSDRYPRILPEKPLLINGFSGRVWRMAAGSPSQRQEPSAGVSGKQPDRHWWKVEQCAGLIPLKEAIQTLHQAILCGLVLSRYVFHVGACQNKLPRPARLKPLK